MSNVQIPNLPAVASLSGEELFEGVQAGSSVKISLGQMIAAARAGTPTTVPLPVSAGGTASDNAPGARTNLGIGTIATQNSDDVSITGGAVSGVTITNITDLAVADGGTGASALTGYVKGNGTSPFTASASVPISDVSGIGTIASQNSNSVDITGGSINGTVIGAAVASSVNATTVNVGSTTVSTTASVNLNSGTSETTQLIRLPSGLGVLSHTASAALQISTSGGQPIQLITSGTEKFRIGSSGQWGIGGANYGTSGQTIISAGGGAAPAWGALGAAGGGTGITSYTIGDIIFASGSTALSRIADVATGNALISGGVGVAPAYGKIGLTTHVSGTLPLANGGTGATTAPAAAAVLLGYTATTTTGGTTVLDNTSSQYQLFSGSTTQTIVLPVTSTLITGWSFHIVNNSTGGLTLNSSGGNFIATIIPGTTAMVTCILTAVTTPAAWEFGYTDFSTLTGTGSNVMSDGATLTSGAFNGTIGATTPSTGAFTDISASGTVSGTGFSTYLASPPAIGGTTPAAATFSTATVSGTLSCSILSGATSALTVSASGTIEFSVGGTRRSIILSDGVGFTTQGNPTSIAAAATLTTAQLATRIIQYTGAAANLTLPTATSLDTYFSLENNVAFEFTIINTGTGTATVAVNTGVTSVGLLGVGTGGTAGTFRLRRVSTGTWVIYRL